MRAAQVVQYETKGAIHSTKISGQNLRNFLEANETGLGTNLASFPLRPVFAPRLKRANVHSLVAGGFRDYREILVTTMVKWNGKFSIGPVQPRKVAHLERWASFFEPFPVGRNRSIQF